MVKDFRDRGNTQDILIGKTVIQLLLERDRVFPNPKFRERFPTQLCVGITRVLMPVLWSILQVKLSVIESRHLYVCIHMYMYV